MSDIAIRVENLGKLYRIGQREPYYTLRDSLAHSLTASFRWFRRAVDGRQKTVASSVLGPQSAVSDPRSPVLGQPSVDGFIWALKDVSFEIKRGEVVGVIGRNGAGKTTLLKILSRITEPTEGFAEVFGRVGSLLEVGTGFHPELTGRENIYLNGAILGMKKAEIDRKFDEIVAFAEVEKFIDTPVKHYSSGMYLRLAFSVAAHLEPEILLVDEVLAVGDASFQKKCLGKIEGVAKGGRTVLFVSHNMAAIQNLCGGTFLLDHGRIIASGYPKEAIGSYLQKVIEPIRDDLLARTDRQGNGRLKFTGFSVLGESEGYDPAVCGEPARFEIKYRAVSALRNVHISVGLYTLLGEGVLYLSNDLIGRSFNDLPPAGCLVCSFAKLPLLSGTYTVNLYCTVNGILADWVRDAGRVHVVEGDYFGTGKLPPRGYGWVTVPHQWDVVEFR